MLKLAAKVLSVDVTAVVHEDKWTGSEGRTGIDKRPKPGRITLAGNTVEGDVIADRKHHGGYDKAVYAYAREDSEPRIPCRVFAGFWDRPNLIKEFTNAGRPGAYLRIIQEGHIGAGDEIVIAARPSHGITISDLFAARGEERSRIFEVLASSEVADSVRGWAMKVNDSKH